MASKWRKCAENGFITSIWKEIQTLQLKNSMYHNPMLLLLFSIGSGTHSLQMRSTGNLYIFFNLFKGRLCKIPYWCSSFIVHWGKEKFIRSSNEPASLPFRSKSKDHLSWVTNTGWCHFRIKSWLPFWSSISIQSSMIVAHMIWPQSHLCLH